MFRLLTSQSIYHLLSPLPGTSWSSQYTQIHCHKYTLAHAEKADTFKVPYRYTLLVIYQTVSVSSPTSLFNLLRQNDGVLFITHYLRAFSFFESEGSFWRRTHAFGTIDSVDTIPFCSPATDRKEKRHVSSLNIEKNKRSVGVLQKKRRTEISVRSFREGEHFYSNR